MEIFKKIAKGIFNVLQIAIKCALIILIVFLTYETLIKVYKYSGEDDNTDFLALPEDSIDVLVLGSSHAQYSFVPALFYADTDLYSYVLGSACQPLKVSYEMLKEALKTQSPKVLILETFTALPARSVCEGDSCYVKAQYKMTGEEKINTIKFLPEDKQETYLNDFNSYHNDWKTDENVDETLKKLKEAALELKDLTIDDLKALKVPTKNDTELGTEFGYVYQDGIWSYPDNWWHPEIHDSTLNVSLDDEDLEALNNIKTLCDKEGIQLILYKTPMDSLDDTNQSMLQQVWNWADKNHVTYINFLTEAEDMNFYMMIHSDSFHCYISGAEMITSKLASLINDLNIKGHKVNDEIEPIYNISAQNYTRDYLQFEYDPQQFLRRLGNTDKGTYLIRYKATGYDVDESFTEFLEKLGLEDFDKNHDYFAVITTKGTEISNESISTTYKGHTIEINKDEIMIDGNTLNDPDCPLTVVYGTEVFDSYQVKDIEYRGKFWQYGIESYIR